MSHPDMVWTWSRIISCGFDPFLLFMGRNAGSGAAVSYMNPSERQGQNLAVICVTIAIPFHSSQPSLQILKRTVSRVNHGVIRDAVRAIKAVKESKPGVQSSLVFSGCCGVCCLMIKDNSAAFSTWKKKRWLPLFKVFAHPYRQETANHGVGFLRS